MLFNKNNLKFILSHQIDIFILINYNCSKRDHGKAKHMVEVIKVNGEEKNVT